MPHFRAVATPTEEIDLSKHKLPARPGSILHSTEQLSRNVFRVNVPLRRDAKWEWWTLLTSDQHWDNPHSNHELQLTHLKEAKSRGAAILCAGDLFCLMQGKYDKRANKSALRPEHQVDNYLDAVINTATQFFAPFAHNFVVVATGNHEQAIADRHETNMIDRFVGAMNQKTGSHIANAGFSGWVIFSFRDGSNPARTPINLHLDHGYGGGGPVTSDLIQHQRRSVYLPDADIVISGHTHDHFVKETSRVRLSPQGNIYHDVQTHVKIPSYKDEYRDGYGGWATATKGMPPKPQGACWLRFFWSRAEEKVLYEVTRAQ